MKAKNAKNGFDKEIAKNNFWNATEKKKKSRPKVSTKKLQKNNNGKEITFMLSSAS